MGLIDTLQGIGDAIREKTGTNEPIPLKNMAEVILNLSGGANCKSAVYNEDDTITLIDNNDKEHIIQCVYGDNGLESVTYDGEIIELVYDEGALVKVADTQIDVSKAPTTSGGAELNIAYGDIEPTDTSKLWIKANEPKSIVIGKDFDEVEGVKISETLLEGTFYNCATVAVDTNIYLIGGFLNGNSTANIYRYDTLTNTLYLTNAQLPARTNYRIAAAKVGEYIYIFYSTYMCKFDISAEILTTLDDPFPADTSEMGIIAVGDRIYLFGGYYRHYNGIYYDRFRDYIRVFDTTNDTISTISTKLETAQSIGAYAIVDKKIYLFGGCEAVNNGTTVAYRDNIYIFDTENHTISTSPITLPTVYRYGASVVLGKKIYLFGGRGANSQYLDTIYVFDTENETDPLSLLNNTLPIGCSGIGCANIGNRVYLFGGYDGSTYLDTVSQFTITHDLAQNNIEVITGSQNFFNVINTDTMKVEIGVDSVLIGDEENKAKVCEAYLYQNDAWVQI